MALGGFRDKIILAGALALGLAGGAALAAQQAPWDWGTADEEWNNSPEYAPSKAFCRQVSGRSVPFDDRPDRAARASLRGCDSQALYYGIGMPADPVRARLCAYIEMEEDGPNPGPSLRGRAMLTTIYANGVGAGRDLDLAIHLACGAWGAPMELDGRVLHLAALRRPGAARTTFDFCDDITSGVMGGFCTGRASRIADVARAAALSAITSRWTPAERRAFTPLRNAFSNYVRAHVDGDVDMSGTLRAAIASRAEDSLEDGFLEILQRLAAGRRPPGDTFAAADRALNTAWGARMAEDFEFAGTVTRDGVRRAQRAWLRYRDAFLAFAAIKYPAASRDAVAAWLTRQRVRVLTQGAGM